MDKDLVSNRTCEIFSMDKDLVSIEFSMDKDLVSKTVRMWVWFLRLTTLSAVT